VKAVATGDEVAFERAGLAAMPVAHHRMVGVEAVHAHVLGLVHRLRPARSAGIHQVARDLGLAVHDHVLAAGQPVQVDAMAAAGPADLDAAVHQPLGVQARADARLVQHVHRALLQHAGADAPEHVVRGPLLEDHVVDVGALQQLPQQQARRAGADDGDLGAHGTPPVRPSCGESSGNFAPQPAEPAL
jgi:hypothetical protein